MPLRLVVGAQYRDAALSVYIKIAALAMRLEGCTAKVSVLAEYLGLSKSVVERALKDLTTPDEVDGLVEVITTRRTLRGGRGQSAHRVVRTATEAEHFVWVPVRAAEALSPRLLRLYALIAYAEARNVPLSVGDLGGMLYHHTGKKAGQHLGDRQAARLLDELGTTGWITVHARQGLQGRHAYETHRHPVHAVAQAPAAAPDIHDGSGADDHAGSLTSREDPRTDRPVTRAGVGGSIRRRRDAGSSARGHSEKRSSGQAGTYRGPGLQLSPRVWQVLEPVRHELPGISPYVLRRIGREIGEQLSAGVGMERLTARLTARYSRLTAHAPAAENARRGDVGRWILGAGLPRHGCRLASCESGTTWSTGERCHLCTNIAEGERLAAAAAEQLLAAAPRPEPPAPVRPPTTWLPMPRPEPGPEPPGPTERERLRAAATPETVRQALAEHGAPAAIRLYGRALVLPHLAQHDEGTTA
ncbi:hypothetical protein [Streptomyces sp. NPDC007094]|uniref:hypothetical protein n=1 Tax=unclassified Streptomyces TaxID=2593676 RepID=UPI0033D0EBC0